MKVLTSTFVMMSILWLSGCGPAGQPVTSETQTSSSTDGGITPSPQTPGSSDSTTPVTWTSLSKPSSTSSSVETTSLCSQLGKRAKDFSIRRLVVAFEGLSSYDSTGVAAAYSLFEQDPLFRGASQISRGSAGYVLHGLLKPLLEQGNGKIEFLSFPHDSQDEAHGSVPEICILAWLKAAPSTKITIIGHSYGGHAANQLASVLDADGVSLDSVFSLDPRTRYYVGTLQRTTNANLWLNFYQTNTPFLNGYQVPGADANIDLSYTGVSHTELPSASEVHARVFDHLLN